MSKEAIKFEAERADYAALVKVASELDEKGLTKEADLIDQVLKTVVAAAGEEKGLGIGAKKSLRTLHKALASFCNKDIDARGTHRRQVSKICDDAEDLRDMILEVVGEGE